MQATVWKTLAKCQWHPKRCILDSATPPREKRVGCVKFAKTHRNDGVSPGYSLSFAATAGREILEMTSG